MQLTETGPTPNGIPSEGDARRDYRRILVAIDTKRDLELVPDAVTLARAHRAILEIVCGCPRLSPFAYSTMGAVALAHQGLIEWQQQIIEGALRHVGKDISVRTRLIEGSAARAVVRSMDVDYDLAVIGRAGRRFQRLTRRCGGAVLCL